MLNNSTSVVTGSNFSFVCPGIFSCFTVFAVEITDGTFRFKCVTALVLTNSIPNMKGYLSVTFDAV